MSGLPQTLILTKWAATNFRANAIFYKNFWIELIGCHQTVIYSETLLPNIGWNWLVCSERLFEANGLLTFRTERLVLNFDLEGKASTYGIIGVSISL